MPLNTSFNVSGFFQSEAQKKLEEIKEFRQKMRQVQDEARNKDDMGKQLVSLVCPC